MVRTLTRNPILLRLVRRGRPPSLKLTIALMLLIAWATALLMGVMLFRAPRLSLSPARIEELLLSANLIAVIITPLIVAGLAAAVTVTDLRVGAYELLRLTELSGTALVQGYTFAALYRMRVMVALAMGLLPAWIMRVLYARIIYRVVDARAVPWLDYLGPLLLMLVVAGGVLVINLLAAGLGVWFALIWRSALIAALLAVLAMVILLPLVLIVAWSVVGPLSIWVKIQRRAELLADFV
ncbi:MAG: hypothetical protein GYB68_18905 [Chloroflexi bacterium]|nr:hypothetical protein [Chloroflexota bacterium]